ncbi:hypothetical protein ACG3RN_23845 [Pseudomonas aeruginosa]
MVVDGTSIADPKTNLAEAALAGRHGVPAFRAVSPPEHHREPDHRADQGTRPQQGRSHQEGPGPARACRSQGHAKAPRPASGGQQQRVAIARALAMDPVVMLF